MNCKTFFICLALVVALSVVTAQRNENMFSPAGCGPNSRPVDCVPINQRTCLDELNENEVQDGEPDAECEGEGCICFEGYIWNVEKTQCVTLSECFLGNQKNQEQGPDDS